MISMPTIVPERRGEIFISKNTPALTIVDEWSNADVGVDIELLRTYKPTVAKRFFHPDEYSLLETLPPQLHDEMFTRLWTLKESYVKYTGTGIANNFDKFAISINLSGLRIKGNDSPVCFKQYNYDGLFVSVCSATDVFPGNIILLTIEEILHTVGN